MRRDRVYLEIAELKVGFSTNTQLGATLKERYSGFLSDSAEIQFTVSERSELEVNFNDSEYIPQIRYLDDGFEIEKKSYFIIRYNNKSRNGTIEFTPALRKLAAPAPPDDSPLAYGLRRAIGVLFVTLLAQEGAPGFHATALKVNNVGILAPGDSGTGKSTFFSMFPEPMQLNDEFVIVRNSVSGPRVFSTPFSETWDKPRKNRSATLRLLLKLKQSPHIESHQLDSKATIVQILNHNMILPDGATRECRSNFNEFFLITENLQAQELKFNLDSNAVVEHVQKITGKI